MSMFKALGGAAAIGATAAAVIAVPAQAAFNPATDACRLISTAQVKHIIKLAHVKVTRDDAPKAELVGDVFSECSISAYNGTEARGEKTVAREKSGDLVYLVIVVDGPEAGPNRRYWNGETPLPSSCPNASIEVVVCTEIPFAQAVELREHGGAAEHPFRHLTVRPPKLGADRSVGFDEFLPLHGQDLHEFTGADRLIEEWSSAASHVTVEMKLYGAHKNVVKQLEQLARIVVPRLVSR
ncbi:MAG: hypothetical protein QOD66_3111 [Solirubrobacteraceae bacterium]|nr:hypothetical protein [Solirubrobacteraceae bacterium]